MKAVFPVVAIDDEAAKTLCISIVRGFGRLVDLQGVRRGQKADHVFS